MSTRRPGARGSPWGLSAAASHGTCAKEQSPGSASLCDYCFVQLSFKSDRTRRELQKYCAAAFCVSLRRCPWWPLRCFLWTGVTVWRPSSAPEGRPSALLEGRALASLFLGCLFSCLCLSVCWRQNSRLTASFFWAVNMSPPPPACAVSGGKAVSVAPRTPVGTGCLSLAAFSAFWPFDYEPRCGCL